MNPQSQFQPLIKKLLITHGRKFFQSFLTGVHKNAFYNLLYKLYQNNDPKLEVSETFVRTRWINENLAHWREINGRHKFRVPRIWHPDTACPHRHIGVWKLSLIHS